MPRDSFCLAITARHGGNFERGIKTLSCGWEPVWEACSETTWVRAIASQKMLANVKLWSFWGSNLFTRMLCTFCPPTILEDFHRIPEKSPNCRRTKCTEHASQKIRSSKRCELYIFQRPYKQVRHSQNWRFSRESTNGGSQMGVLRPLSAICAQSSTIVHFFWPFWAPF